MIGDLNNFSIDIVMPNYNSAKYLSDTIESVLSQTFKNWKLIIVDDHSDLETQEILKKYESHENINIIWLEENKRAAYCRNLAMKKSKSEYIAFLDSDDIWYENKLTIQLDYIKKYNLVCSLSNKIDEKGLMIYEESTVSDQLIDLSALVMRNKIVHSSVVVHKNLFLSIMFDEDKLLNGLENRFLQIIT